MNQLHHNHLPKNNINPTTMPIICILGGPGAGKGTICTALSKKYTLHHLSIGDLLREEEQNPESPYAELIKYNLAHGLLGPMEITTRIIRDAMIRITKEDNFVTGFLIDGEYASRIMGIKSVINGD